VHGAGVDATIPSDNGEWNTVGKDYVGTRFSALDQINTDNVKQLKLACTFSTGVTRGHEAPPLVAKGTMYVVTPFPNILYAIDLTKPGAPTKWTYKPEVQASAQGVACCDVVNRGAAWADGKVIIDGSVVWTVCSVCTCFT
jgi:lanthanide-dependent methanol dehydrogenase